jgi:hypothetical protein
MDDPELPLAFASMDADDIRHFLTNVQGEGNSRWWMPDHVVAQIIGVCGRVLSPGELKQLLEQFGCLSAFTASGFSKTRVSVKSLAVARALEASGNPWAHRFVDGGRPHPLTAAVQAHVASGSGLSPAVVDRIVSGAMCVDEYRMLAEEGFGEMRGKRDYHSTEILVAANPTGQTECSTVVSLPPGPVLLAACLVVQTRRACSVVYCTCPTSY